jgi:hypothetical protein
LSTQLLSSSFFLQLCTANAEDLPQQLLCQLVASLLVHSDAASTAELQQAMRDLCQLTQRRIDGLQLSKLMAGFADAQAAVAAAAGAAATEGGTGTGVTSECGSYTSSKASTSDGTRRSSTAAADAGSALKLTEDADSTAAAAAVYMTPAVPKSRSRLGLMQASASARKPQSRLKALQKSSSKAAASADEDGISSLAGLMATKLQLAADEDEEDKENAQDTAAPGDDCRTNAAQAVLQPAVTAKQGQPQRAGSAAAGGRRVRFAAEAQQDEGQQIAAGLSSTSCALDGDAYEHLVVPQSLARHAVRRSRLSEGQGCLIAAAAAGASSSSRRSATHTAAASGSGSGVSSAAAPVAAATSSNRPVSRPRLGAAASANQQLQQQLQQQQQQRAWVPSVLLLLDGQVQQLPWESCQGLGRQNMYRWARQEC